MSTQIISFGKKPPLSRDGMLRLGLAASATSSDRPNDGSPTLRYLLSEQLPQGRRTPAALAP
jgi:hypothetical protein